ncbi:PhzF family phenazine biosynthesis protein [Streptomyces sp. RKAG293]|uniref:PhzF family phenazine biosynthesis protein n=1 Tax=Streptomyces sp. RKAG293 TaxID=2893403 RepID=UPI002033EB19|nr:PhzF family phenazine biosynthesis protein [Streptomyces sp. RKAG293]MCM2416836.1 PhzF family phenazine biosynthesis protein [Streptomyces sp. RKAG293]
MSRPSRRPAVRTGLPVTIVHACLREGGGGSPTAVLDEASSSLSGRLLTDDERRAAPALAGTSHAVFLSRDGEPAAGVGHDRLVVAARFFTADGELPACGHGTVAALAFLAQRAGGGEHRAGLRVAGRVVEGRVVCGASSVEAAFEAGPVGLREPTAGELALLLPALGLGTAVAAEACIATLGRPRLLLPVPTRSALAALAPDLDRLAAACDHLGLLGAFVHAPMSPSGRVVARMFAPSIGVPEDIANANSSACLAAHLLGRQGATGISVDMGDALGRPSTVTADTRHTSSGVVVDVRGAARIGHELRLPGRLAPPGGRWEIEQY